ncbi:ATPase AAA domaincontaining protein, variant 2 [Perkinsus olseni]|nr:ATPase AAA domaincontaining protein, variant 2 [Perkinsus olseni]
MVSSETPAEQGDKVASDSSASSRESTEGKSSSNKGDDPENGRPSGSVDGRYTGAADNASNASLGATRGRPSLERQSGIRYIPLGIRHDTFEVERHQRLLKTKFCRYGPNCEFARKGQCFFVHSPQELKYRPPKPIGYPVRPRGSQYDEYDDFYYGEAENDYYFDNQYYGQGQDVSSPDYERSGINNEPERDRKATPNTTTEPALIAMELAVQIRDFATTPERLQLLIQAMGVLASSEATDENGGDAVANVALTLAASLGVPSPTPSNANTHRPTVSPSQVEGHPAALPEEVKRKFKMSPEIAGSAETDVPGGSCAQHIVIFIVATVQEVAANNWLLQCSSCVDQSMFGDISLKSDVQPANHTKLYEQLRKMQLRVYTHTEREFFNKFFATRQLGLIAQELQAIMPEAVSLLPERRWTSLNGTQARTKNVYMVREAHLLMTALGALQELAARHEHVAGDYWDRVSKWSSEMKKINEDMSRVNDEQIRQSEKVQGLNTKVHVVNHDIHRLETAVEQTDTRGKKQEFEVDRLKEDHRHLTSRMDDKMEVLMKAMVKSEEAMVREREGLNRKLETESERSKRSLDDLKDSMRALRSLHYSLSFLVEDYRQEAVERGEGVSRNVEELQERLSRVNSSLEEYGELYQRRSAELSSEIEDDRRRLASLESNVTELWKAMEKQASEDLLQITKHAELELEATMAKIRLEKMRLEMERSNMERQQELQKKADEHQDDLHRRRVAAESDRREAHDAKMVEMQEESQLRQQKASHDLEMERLNRTVDAERAKAEAEAQKEIELTRVREEARLRDRRENEDVNLREMEAKAKHDLEAMEIRAREDRETTLQNIRESVHQARESISWFFSSPTQVLRTIGFLAGCAASIYFTREMAMLARDQLNKRLGKPSLLRRTSRKSLAHDVRDWIFNRGAPSRVFSDVVLRPDHLFTIKRLADATRTAKQRGQPLLHCMFYGPPGTGKTMTAERFAEYSGLEYAIMCGADVAPLNEMAVTELHNLFDWVKKSRRGVLLFIDEADAFLGARTAGMGEHMRNALTTMLYHTGTPSSQFMLVLATNRPGDLDAAVLDRIDESVEFGLPDTIERHMLCRMYYEKYVVTPMKRPRLSKLHVSRPSSPLLKPASVTVVKRGGSAAAGARKTASVRRRSRPHVEEGNPEESRGPHRGHSDATVDDDCLYDVAEKLSGFSGREIAKLFMSLQTHIYSLGIETIEEVRESVLKDVADSKLTEHSQTVEMMDNGYKYRGSRC